MPDRRKLFALALGAATALGRTDAASSQQAGAPTGAPQMSLAECIAICLKCHGACLEAAAQVLAGPAPAEANLVVILLDCAEICQATANSMSRASPVHTAFCGACAQVCDACAAACGRASDAAALNACRQVCRDCAMSCRHIAGPMH